MTAIADLARGAAQFVPATPPHTGGVDGAATFTASDMAAGWGAAVDDLLRLRKLTDDWDGQGSSAPGSAVVDAAITLAQQFRASWPLPGRVHAGVNGTVCFEWFTPLGYIEVEVTAPNVATHRFVSAGSKEVVSVTLGR